MVYGEVYENMEKECRVLHEELKAALIISPLGEPFFMMSKAVFWVTFFAGAKKELKKAP